MPSARLLHGRSLMPAIIRTVEDRDIERIAAIYAPYVTGSAISFEIAPPDADTMAQRIGKILAVWPWLVYEREGEVLGYAYGSEHRTRAAYRWDVDVSAYVHPQAHRQGVGRALYTALFDILRLQGFYNAMAGIALPNPASVGLHEAMGFRPVGVYPKAGYKLGRWHDVGWWQLALREASDGVAPLEPTLFFDLCDTESVTQILAQASAGKPSEVEASGA